MIKPEQLDIFGFLGFVYITSLAIWSLKFKKRVPLWALIILLLIGLTGLIVDGLIIYFYILI